jgi:hypothetical protein
MSAAPEQTEGTPGDYLLRPRQRGYATFAAGNTRVLASVASPAGLAKALKACAEHFGKAGAVKDDLEALDAQLEGVDANALRRVLCAAGLQLVVIEGFIGKGCAAPAPDPGSQFGPFA